MPLNNLLKGKTARLNVRLPWDELHALNNLCEDKGYSQADFIRKAIRELLIKEQRSQTEWSPVQEYSSFTREPGQGWDESKGRWNPDLITSHNQKLRDGAGEKPRTYQEKVAARQRDRQ